MIISVDKAKKLVDLDGWTDEKILMKLKAIEQTIRAYTHNNFQQRECRSTANINGGAFLMASANLFEIGDTIQVSESGLNAGLYTVISVEDSALDVAESVKDENGVLVTRIVYPADVIDCCINLLEWEKKHREKVGIQSETLSRHSVTYFNQDANNQIMGYPVSLLGCLKAYRKARF